MSRVTSKIFLEILDQPRQDAFRLLSKLPRGGVLGGGTALALQIGHRRSFDFDILYEKHIRKEWLRGIGRLFGSALVRTIVDNEEELTVLLQPDIKLTLLHYPFPRMHPTKKIGNVSVLHPYDIATSKAYAIGRRGAWRDYVDIYFLLKQEIVGLSRLIAEAEKRYGGLFNGKLFLQQLQYVDDISDMSIELIYPAARAEIKKFLKTAVQSYAKEKIIK